MNFLVTGGAGFIGSNIVEELLKQGHSVRVLDNFSTGKRKNIEKFLNHIELIEGDIRDYYTVCKAVKKVEVILHEAALPSVQRSIDDPLTTNDVNVTGTLNLLIAAKENRVRRMVYASSSSVYGNSAVLPKHELMNPSPLSPYAVSKLIGEYYCRLIDKNIEAIILRYFNVFGPRQDCNSHYSAVIPKFINKIINNESPVIFGDGEQTRDFTYVSNVVDANILAAYSDCETPLVMNCACHSQISLNQLVSEINLIFGKNIQPVYSEPRAGDIKHSFADIQLIKSKLSYEPGIDFQTGLRKTINYYLEVPAYSAGIPLN